MFACLTSTRLGCFLCVSAEREQTSSVPCATSLCGSLEAGAQRGVSLQQVEQCKPASAIYPSKLAQVARNGYPGPGDVAVPERCYDSPIRMSLPRTPELEAALDRAGDEIGLQAYYRDCVRPLFGMAPAQWPRCCGRGCEPCTDTLIAVAERVYELLGVDAKK